jgi:hypothetical protein
MLDSFITSDGSVFGRAIMSIEVRNMGQLDVIEGTGEELERYLRRSPKQRFRLIPLSNEESRELNKGETHPARLDPPIRPNEGMLAVMRDIAERQKSRLHTDGSDSLRLLREARAGAMYGRDPTDE